ncbi:hypothetical protein ES703_66425 [subsurface metagenome]
MAGLLKAGDELLKEGGGGFIRHFQPQLPGHLAVKALLLQNQGNLIYAFHVGGLEDVLRENIGEQGELGPYLIGEVMVFHGAADQNVGLQADLPQALDAVLGGFGLQFVALGNERHQGQVHDEVILPAHFQAELADSLPEGLTLDVAHRAAHLADDQIESAPGIHQLDPPLDLISDVGYYLNGLAQVVAPALPVEDLPVDLAGSGVVEQGHVNVDEALVVAQVQVSLGAVVQDENLSVLVGIHGARVHVQVGVQLQGGDLYPPRFE